MIIDGTNLSMVRGDSEGITVKITVDARIKRCKIYTVYHRQKIPIRHRKTNPESITAFYGRAA